MTEFFIDSFWAKTFQAETFLDRGLNEMSPAEISAQNKAVCV